MNKKILIGSISVIFMLVAISYATAVNTNTTNAEEKESPLWRIRTRKAISEKISDIIDNIKTKFIWNRIFFLPSLKIENVLRQWTGNKVKPSTCLRTVGCTYDPDC